MTRKWGDTGLAMMGSRHVLTITYPDPDETLLGTPEAVPTSEPETPQVEYTIAAGHLPNIGGASAVWTPMLWASGYNDTAGRITLSYRLLKNDVSVQTGTQSVTAGRYWTVNCYNYYDSAVGDKIQLSLWASGAGLDWRTKALFVYPTRLDYRTTQCHVVDRVVYTYAALPALTAGNPTLPATSFWHLTDGDMAKNQNSAGSLNLGALHLLEPYLGGYVSSGDSNRGNASSGASTTGYPYNYYRNAVPTQIIYYPLAVR